MREPLASLDRRSFVGYALKGAALGVAVRFGVDALAPSTAQALVAIPELADELDLTDLLIISGTPFYYDYLIQVTPENRIVFELPRMEVGQGILTTAMMILAEEIDVRLDQIDASLSSAEFRRATGQITGGSHSTTSLWDPLRRVAATFRQQVVQAAAARFGIAPTDVTTQDAVASAPDGRSAPYADLDAGTEGPMPLSILAEPKSAEQYRVIGQPTRRVDAHDIVTGKVDYAMDLEPVAGALPCVVARPPTLLGRVASYDDSAARDLPGVEAIMQVDLDVEGSSSGVAVVARSTGEAFRARDALQITWQDGPSTGVSDDDVIDQLRAANLPTLPDIPLLTDSVGGEFIFPYFAHAPMETMTAIADVSGGTARIWTGAKTPLSAQAKIARDLGMLPTDVEVNVIKTGGSFGRRLFFDAAIEAARISRALGRPIKLLFTRQDDTSHGRCRPLSVHDVKATYTRGLLGGGEPLTFDHRAATAQLDLEHGFGDAITSIGGELVPFGFNQTVWHTTQLMQYEVGVTTLLLNETPLNAVTTAVPTASWRGIYSGTAAVANEIVIDELARALGHDEAQFRLDRLDDDRSRAVLQTVLTEGGWGRSLPSGVAQGIGLHKEYKSRAAYLVELDTRGAEPRVTRATCAVDVGRAINPLGLESQMQGALVDAISYIIRTAIHLDDGAIRESSYGDFEVPRMDHTPPEMSVHVMPPTEELPGGAGELGITASAAAVANAYARATGRVPRRFPINEYPEG
ncbi:xanthine dehydrogenase family protein molybdopterin-binding subunit [Euzebya tangerina]|uniref:xanthine dehydrogenase family protein molybdopterin-binding subunit n=1 Tax=Euzebya tangerina TaxID=591198 RepID=UPI002F31F3DB